MRTRWACHHPHYDDDEGPGSPSGAFSRTESSRDASAQPAPLAAEWHRFPTWGEPLSSGAMADELVIDLWSSLDHKAGMGKTAGGIDGAPKWLPDMEKRRLNAYLRIRAYLETVARELLIEDAKDPDRRDSWREYGDPQVMVQRVAAAMLGKEPTVGVIGADRPVSDSPDIRPAPRKPAEGLEPEEKGVMDAVYTATLVAWKAEAESTLAAWLEDLEALPKLKGREEWLQKWAKDEQFLTKLHELERECIVPLGSGVMAFGWDHARKRVGCEIFEPDAYFPILSERTPGEFPRRVHLAWQYKELNEAGEEEDWVRRITYELVPVVPVDGEDDPAPGVDRGEMPVYIEDAEQWRDSCLLTDATWPAGAFEKVDGLDEGAVYSMAPIVVGGPPVALQQVAIGLDFIPVVHWPNTPALLTHFGRSFLACLFQLLDELAATDMDEALASRWAGRPPLVAKGMEPGATEINLTPGAAIRSGPGGGIETIDMAPNLEAIGERINRLLKRLSVNGSVPEGLIGRVDAAEVPSGLALALSFTAFEQMVGSGREARELPGQLALKFVQRIALVNQDETLDTAAGGDALPAEVRFGAYMPQDLAGGASVLKLLRDAGLISQETGIRMAQERGAPVTDVSAEVLAIRSEMGEEALRIADATGDPKYAARFLGLADFEADSAAGNDNPGGAGVDANAPVTNPAADQLQ